MELGTIEPIPGLPHVYGRGPFKYSIRETLVVPPDLAPGHYVLSWRWDAEQTKQVWSQCSDVYVNAATTTTAASAATAPATATATATATAAASTTAVTVDT